MKEETKEGAEAAIRYFWDAHYYAERTGDTEVFDSLYSEYCEFCGLRTRSIKGIYKDNGWYTGTDPRIESMLTSPSENGYISTLLITSEAGTGYSSDGSIPDDARVDESPKQPWIAEVSFDTQNGRWVIDEMTYEGGDPSQ